jgi:hypothetical protein
MGLFLLVWTVHPSGPPSARSQSKVYHFVRRMLRLSSFPFSAGSWPSLSFSPTLSFWFQNRHQRRSDLLCLQIFSVYGMSGAVCSRRACNDGATIPGSLSSHVTRFDYSSSIYACKLNFHTTCRDGCWGSTFTSRFTFIAMQSAMENKKLLVRTYLPFPTSLNHQPKACEINHHERQSVQGATEEEDTLQLGGGSSVS